MKWNIFIDSKANNNNIQPNLFYKAAAYVVYERGNETQQNIVRTFNEFIRKFSKSFVILPP